MSWYINLLIKEQIYPKKIYEQNYKYAFLGTINWMKALSLIIDKKPNLLDEYKTYLTKRIKKFYKNKNDFSIIFENILMSFHYLNSLKIINNSISKTNIASITRTQIINWYYVIYYSAKAMTWVENKTYSEQHSGVAKDWHQLVTKNLIMHPFDLHLNTLVKKDYENQIKKYKIQFKATNNQSPLNKTPQNINNAYTAIIAYLKGTATFYREKAEKEIKENNKLKDFRQTKAQKIRDKKLEKKQINFLHEAFRYRGKANYRDSLFLMYKKEDNKEDKLFELMQNLENVGETFIKMSLIFIKQKAYIKRNKYYFENFYKDLKKHLLYDCNLVETLYKRDK